MKNKYLEDFCSDPIKEQKERYKTRDHFEDVVKEAINNLQRKRIEEFNKQFDKIFDLITDFNKSDKKGPYKDNYKSKKFEEIDKNYHSGKGRADIIYVNPTELPNTAYSTVLGMYVPSTHTIYIANNLSPDVENFVYYHEIAHSYGIINERQADLYAEYKTGYSMAA
jgi:hypothetical protein